MTRVLIVEDMAIIAFSLRDMLEDMGYDVIGIASSVDTALDSVARLDPPPDVVLLDADLRGLSSRPVAQRLRQRRIPFVVASGYGDEKLFEMAENEPTVSKPVDQALLQQTLIRLGQSAH